jgi:predicted dehydrogenase
VCVPNSLHAAVVLDAFQHGKAVVCEKPLAHNVESASSIVRAAKSTHLVAQVCFYYRLWPAIAWAHELVEQGAIGRIQYFRGWMLQDYAARVDQDLGWRAKRATAGAGALGDLGSHIFDIARYLAGPIARVSATTHALVQRAGDPIDDLVSALVTFESGAGGVVEASWAMRGHKCDLGFDLIGTSGAIRFSWERFNEIEILTGDPDDPANGFKRVLIGGGQPDADRFVGVPGQGLGYRDAFAVGLGHFARAVIAGDTEVAPSFDDGLRVAELVEASLRSAAGAGWTELPTV